MKLVWSRPASIDRKAIRDDIARDNPSAALAIDELIAEMARKLRDHPGIGRLGRVTGTCELVVHRNYLLIYDVVDGQVRVLGVLHAARRWRPDESGH